MKIDRIEAFQVQWSPHDKAEQRSAFVRVRTDDGLYGVGEASPMQGGLASLGMIVHNIAPALIGADPLDQAVLQDRLLHRLVKLGPEGALTGALAAIDIALWDLKGKAFGQPVYKLLGGAWKTALPFYASIGGNGAGRSIDEVLGIVEKRLRDKPAAIKIRFDNPRIDLDEGIADHIAKARAVRKMVGDDFPLAFDANNGYSPSGAIRVGRALEEQKHFRSARAVYEFAAELGFAFRLARHLKAGREVRRGKPENFNRPDYNFRLEGGDGGRVCLGTGGLRQRTGGGGTDCRFGAPASSSPRST